MSSDEEDVPTLLDTVEPTIQLESSSGKSGTVPLTIICGFLGAGKSTLVRRILSEHHGYRIAVIMNDFGDTADIEAKTINVSSPDDPTQALSEEVLELANGCLCCSIRNSGIAAIEKLMQRKGAFDHILLETTGLADPGPIASLFWQNEEFSKGLGNDIHLDGVVCVVDAVFGDQQLHEDHSEDGIGESLRQIACADVVLLNKVDLVTSEQLKVLEGHIKRVNPGANIYRTVRGQIDLKYIMGIEAYAMRTLQLGVNSADAPSNISDHDHDHCGHDHEHETPAHHYEIRGITSLQVSCPTLTKEGLQALDEWIREILWESKLPGDAVHEQITVLRCKGMFQAQDRQVYVLQGVRNLYEIAPLEAGREALGVPDEGKLVLIGKGLDEAVRKSLHDVLNRHLASNV
ncbi:hypothetical protein NM688_g654 [Phlebia brevispora]|uniref:Uncharacterized protein n=1 Tax=Phlebia brevispora TaxID=194682 RepID=A0ACC1TE17_9APHY|nr:hypothetical protein NM688_g654 [Phlebia brevispora]